MDQPFAIPRAACVVRRGIPAQPERARTTEGLAGAAPASRASYLRRELEKHFDR